MMSQQEYLGHGSIGHVQIIINDHQAKKIFLVTGKKSFSQSGAEGTLYPYLENKDVTRLSDFDANPKLEDVQLGIKIIKETKPDLIIAIGGGSVIDMGKLINILAAQSDNDASQIIKNSYLIKNKGLPLIAIPTTAGTGSEATHFAAVYINKVKYSLGHNYMLPDYAIVEPTLSYSLPSKIAATTAMDALSQAVESYWAVGSTDDSKEYASGAIKMILPILVQAVNSDNKDAKNAMAMAANLAGKAINISKTTVAHAISYPITIYYDVPHGHAVALTLGKFFKIHADIKNRVVNDSRGASHVQRNVKSIFKLLGCSDAKSCEEKWYGIMKKIGLDTNLPSMGIDSSLAVNAIVRGVNAERLQNNPVQISQKDITMILNSLRF